MLFHLFGNTFAKFVLCDKRYIRRRILILVIFDEC